MGLRAQIDCAGDDLVRANFGRNGFTQQRQLASFARVTPHQLRSPTQHFGYPIRVKALGFMQERQLRLRRWLRQQSINRLDGEIKTHIAKTRALELV